MKIINIMDSVGLSTLWTFKDHQICGQFKDHNIVDSAGSSTWWTIKDNQNCGQYRVIVILIGRY